MPDLAASAFQLPSWFSVRLCRHSQVAQLRENTRLTTLAACATDTVKCCVWERLVFRRPGAATLIRSYVTIYSELLSHHLLDAA